MRSIGIPLRPVLPFGFEGVRSSWACSEVFSGRFLVVLGFRFMDKVQAPRGCTVAGRMLGE